MQPIVSAIVTRGSGNRLIDDPSPDTPVPEYDKTRLVAACDAAISVAVVHAQDTHDIDVAFAEAQIEVRALPFASPAIGPDQPA